MAGMEVSNIHVADIQPFTASIKEIDQSRNSVSGKEFGVQSDENDPVKQSTDETDTINSYKTKEFNPDDIIFQE
jgi:hypothetical protein